MTPLDGLGRAAWRRLPGRVQALLEPIRRRWKGGLSRRDVKMAYRVLLDRRPESMTVVEQQVRANVSMPDLRRRLLGSQEFREKNSGLVDTGESAVAMIELPDGVRLWLDLADQAVAIPILRGRFEPDELRFVRSVVREGDSVIDLGANVGLFTVVMAQLVGPRGSVQSFEPRSEIADLLERSVRENGFEDRVRVVRLAVGSRAGSMPLAYPDDRVNLGGAQLVAEGRTAARWMTLETVSVTTLEECDLRRPVRFIKMDIEGAEPLAVAGAARLLRQDRPVILSEVHPLQLQTVSGRSAADYIAQVTAIGYGCHRLENGAPGAELRDVASSHDVLSVVFLPLCA